MENYQRQGYILSKSSILKNETQETVNNLKKHNNIILTNQPTIESIYQIKKTHKKCIFISLKEEPWVFINGIPYILKEAKNPKQYVQHYQGINLENIEEIEIRLKEEIENEFIVNKKLKIMHDNFNDSILQDTYLNNIDVKTEKEFMKESGYDYLRVPISSHNCGIDNGSLDKLIDLFKNAEEDNTYVIYSSRGVNRVYYVLFLYKIIESIKLKKDMKNIDKEKMKIYYKNESEKMLSLYKLSDDNYEIIKTILMGNFKIVKNLLHIMEISYCKKKVDEILFDIDSENDLKVIIFKMMMCINNNDEININKIIVLLARYITLIIATEFIILSNERSMQITFIEYLKKKYEYINLYEYLTRKVPRVELLFPYELLFKEQKEWPGQSFGKYTGLVKDTKYKENIVTNGINIGANPSKIADLENVIWINLREEPVIYIKNKPYVLRDINKYSKNVTYLRLVKRIRLELIEKELKDKINSELKHNNEILFYKLKNDNVVPRMLSDIKEDEIKTQDEYFTNLSLKSYIRFPCTSSISFRFSLFDKLLLKIKDNEICFDKNANFYLHANTNTGRAAYVSIILDLILKKSTHSSNDLDLLQIEKIDLLVRILEDGIFLQSKVEYLFKKYFQTSFKDFILTCDHFKKIIRSIKKYFLIICFASYIEKNVYSQTFEDWIMNRHEIINLYKGLDNLQYDDFEDKTKIDMEIKNRKGEILSAMMILKNDYFIGSRFFKLYDHIKGTQNLRFVQFDNNIITGVSIPTEKGIANTIKKIKELSKDDDPKITWVCLREEPVIYINKYPYVLRNINKMNDNIMMTGISTEVIENTEERLKRDVFMKNEILLHKEVEQEDVIINKGINIKIESVETMKEVYNKFNIDYHRIPVTDEQAPIPIIIDKLYGIINKIDDPKYIIFNCQIGKGRTTTGMIISYLIYNQGKIKGKVYETQYKLISMLLQLLPNASTSKQILDAAIDTMDHLENFREIIKITESKKDYVKMKNFLLRYFYLIVFSEFLIQNKGGCFVEFLRYRREITNLANKINEIGADKI